MRIQALPPPLGRTQPHTTLQPGHWKTAPRAWSSLVQRVSVPNSHAQMRSMVMARMPSVLAEGCAAPPEDPDGRRRAVRLTVLPQCRNDLMPECMTADCPDALAFTPGKIATPKAPRETTSPLRLAAPTHCPQCLGPFCV